nr:uncharacterized protein LOC120975692 [Aegilops tauschii subsp. strangulata]
MGVNALALGARCLRGATLQAFSGPSGCGAYAASGGAPPPQTSGGPACGPTSGARLLLVLEPQEGCWTEEFKAYLLQGTLSEKEEDAERVARQATTYFLREDCGHHSSSRTLAGKTFRSGFYWPTSLSDAIELVRSFEACQFHAKKIHQPA